MMPRSTRLAISTLAAVMALALGPVAPATACSCVGLPPEVQEAQADLVFVGAAVDVRRAGPAPDTVQFLFAVEEVRKGPTLASAVVTTNASDVSCGAGFTVDSRWLVLANRAADGGWTSWLCSGNQLLGPAADVPRGVAEWPDQAARAAQGDANPALPLQSFVMIVVVALLAIASGFAFLWRGSGPGRRDRAG